MRKHKEDAYWKMNQHDMVLFTIKLNTCHDHQGLINELFKPDVAAQDVKYSLLSMLNKVKDTLTIQEMMQNVNIAMISNPGGHDIHNISSNQ